MYVSHIALTNFRNYARLELELQARIHLFQGQNAQGKTNLLEALYYMATTRSPLASSDRQLVRWDASSQVLPHADIECTFVRGGQEHTVAVVLALEPSPQMPGTTVLRKRVHYDGTPRRAIDVVGKLNAVLFLPEDISIVSGAPGQRRRYLDAALCQIDGEYCRSLARYNRVLSQRNALLKRLREGSASQGELAFWDDQLATLGALVLVRRHAAVVDLARVSSSILNELTGERESLLLAYSDTVASALGLDLHEIRGDEHSVVARVPAVSEPEAFRDDYLTAYDRVRRDEIARGVTLIGPHRDDLRFILSDVDATTYGSRGQQRTIALALKLGQVQVMRDRVGEMPLLLLDDVLSELDHQRGAALLRMVEQAEQVMMTTTDLGYYAQPFLGAATLWRVAQGEVEPIKAP